MKTVIWIAAFGAALMCLAEHLKPSGGESARREWLATIPSVERLRRTDYRARSGLLVPSRSASVIPAPTCPGPRLLPSC